MIGNRDPTVPSGPPISFVIPTAKRRASLRTDVDGIYPYYAGFSPAFADAVLKMSAAPDRVVLDPWNGSGTTTLAAARRAMPAFGSDLNPFALVLATAKLLDAQTADAIFRRIARLREPKSVSTSVRGDALAHWFPADLVRAFRRIQADCAQIASDAPSVRPAGVLYPTTAGAALLVALIHAARPLAVPCTLSNPTWARPKRRKSGTPHDLFHRFVHELASLSAIKSRLLPAAPRGIELRADDSRHLSLGDNSVDIAVTSPPYCTRIDYAVTTSFELAALRPDWASADVRAFRELLMGTTAIRADASPEIPVAWPHCLRTVLSRVRQHSSHASERYYFKNLWQYFDDADRSFRELARVLRPGGSSFVVAQTSFYKEIEINLPFLLRRLAERHGLVGSLLAASAVWPVMANLNSAAKKHLGTRAYSEAVVRLEKRND